MLPTAFDAWLDDTIAREGPFTVFFILFEEATTTIVPIASSYLHIVGPGRPLGRDPRPVGPQRVGLAQRRRLRGQGNGRRPARRCRSAPAPGDASAGGAPRPPDRSQGRALRSTRPAAGAGAGRWHVHRSAWAADSLTVGRWYREHIPCLRSASMIIEADSSTDRLTCGFVHLLTRDGSPRTRCRQARGSRCAA